MAADMQKGVAASEIQSCVPGDQPVYPVLRQLTSKQPIVTQIDGLLTPAECAYLVKTAHGAGFEASEIEGRGEVRSLRTSRTADLPEDDPVVQCIERRLATIAGMPATSLEPLQATSYARGERYKTHHDVPRDGGGRGYKRRLKTIFAYLQADGELPAGRCGGATCFHRLRGSDGKSLRVYPRAGSAVMWTNYDDMGRRDTRTEHSGEEVTCPDVVKVGLNAWLHGEERLAAERSPMPSHERRSRPRRPKKK